MDRWDEWARALEREPGADFQADFVRRTNLERTIIDETGLPGLAFLMKRKFDAEVWPLEDAPAGCPWGPGASPEETIRAVFEPIAGELPGFLPELVKHCLGILSARMDGAWYLLYACDMRLYDGRRYYNVYVGGAPDPSPQLPEQPRALGWTMPPDLVRFYAVHDGFGAAAGQGGSFWWNNYVKPARELRTMGELMNPIVEEQKWDVPFSFDDLLEFCPDGSGNCQSFVRSSGGTVDYDHEVVELSDEMPFFEFIDERLPNFEEE